MLHYQQHLRIVPNSAQIYLSIYHLYSEKLFVATCHFPCVWACPFDILSWSMTLPQLFLSLSLTACLAVKQTEGLSEWGQTLPITQAVRLTRHGTGRQLVPLEETFAFLSHPGDVWITLRWRGNMAHHQEQVGSREWSWMETRTEQCLFLSDTWSTFTAHPASLRFHMSAFADDLLAF